jgi:chorismate dehydratase
MCYRLLNTEQAPLARRHYLPIFAAKITILSRKIKVSAVSYLNTKPLLYGIERHPVLQQMELDSAYPALVAKRLQEGSIDMGLLPVAVIPTIPGARIVSNYGIAAEGKVASVCIFSRVPMNEIGQVYLDYQSRTSVKLAALLLKKHWQQDVQLLPAPDDFIEHIQGNTAGVIIGDRALQCYKDFPYVYDLAEHWQQYSGLPFVFAAWVATTELNASFIKDFDEANEQGLQHIDDVIAGTDFPFYDLNVYYKANIQYRLDAHKRQGLQRFLEEIS